MTSLRHLTEEQLLDAAEALEGSPAADDAARRHLAVCTECREQVDGVRRVLGVVQAVDVPEPSPLFWDHLSARIRETVSAESAPVAAPRRWWQRWGAPPWGLQFGVAAVVVLLAAVAVWQRSDVSSGIPPETAVLTQGADITSVAAPVDADDPSLTLLADLAGGLEWDEAMEAGISLEAGATDAVVADLSVDERVELHRLLTEALNAL